MFGIPIKRVYKETKRERQRKTSPMRTKKSCTERQEHSGAHSILTRTGRRQFGLCSERRKPREREAVSTAAVKIELRAAASRTIKTERTTRRKRRKGKVAARRFVKDRDFEVVDFSDAPHRRSEMTTTTTMAKRANFQLSSGEETLSKCKLFQARLDTICSAGLVLLFFAARAVVICAPLQTRSRAQRLYIYTL